MGKSRKVARQASMPLKLKWDDSSSINTQVAMTISSTVDFSFLLAGLAAVMIMNVVIITTTVTAAVFSLLCTRCCVQHLPLVFLFNPLNQPMR